MNGLIYVAILPVIILLNYINKKDSHQEPKKLLRKVFIFGILSVIPILIVEMVLKDYFPTDKFPDLITLFISVFVGIALVEEFFKWLVVKIFVYNKDEFDESYDGIVYAVYSSLGFACLENILYVLGNGIKTGLIRAVTAVPGHAYDGIIMGYFLGKAGLYRKKGDKSKEKLNIFFSLLFPTITHTIYDFLLFARDDTLIIVWIFYVIFTTIICMSLANKSSKSNKLFLETQAIEQSSNIDYCPNCGTKYLENANFCTKCGMQKK